MHTPKKVLILGSGGLRIGQAGEFDYSGSQAIKALKEEGITTVLVNPNIATVQTDSDMADTVYFLPLTYEFISRIIAKEKPDALLLSFGGQTALNVGLELEERGVLKKHQVHVLGTPTNTIRLTEDRKLFAQKLHSIDVSVAKSFAVHTVEAGIAAAEKIGYPLMIRSGFALGGEGSGIMQNKKQLQQRLQEAFSSSHQVLIEEYLGGWKEIEYEVVRDQYDNCVTVCNMENLDPMGIHTGESIVVAPSQTLNNHEYQLLRTIAMKVVRSLGIIGECNIQYALDPASHQYRVIEVNARLSRSSALASKATGYPLAWVAAKLALGYALPTLKNAVTKTTVACFEPALDYIALKFPRWDLKKFKSAERTISTEMKSVGEVMALGRTFEEVLQKAIRMTDCGYRGLVANDTEVEKFLFEIEHPTDRRLFAVAKAFAQGYSISKIHQLSKIDPWFLYRIQAIVQLGKKIQTTKNINKQLLLQAKQSGFSDEQIAKLTHKTEKQIRSLRKRHAITPVVKQIDTLAGEYPAKTNYLYTTYHGSEHDLERSKKQLIVLGSGPYRIGSSVEFDWCCVQAMKAAKQQKYQTIMINCNPETVSTDYDECDRLYFEELTLERVLDIVEFEQPEGIIVSMGGQTPNNLAMKLYTEKVPILGTSPVDIDKAENRHTFSKLLDRLDISQPEWKELTSLKAAKQFARKVGYPVLIRPSYVLSGAAMNVAFNEESLEQYLHEAVDVSREYPVVITKFVVGAREIEFDGVAQQGELKLYAMTEHIENAGVHSGDAHVVFPPQKTYLETIRRAKRITKQIVKELQITGPFNIQFLAKENEIRIIELNLRASRSFPFVSKAANVNFAQEATRAMLGNDIKVNFQLDFDYVVVKAPQFSYNRIKGADPVLYVEMGSTGEVAAFGDSYEGAVLKAMLAAGMKIPKKNILLSIGQSVQKEKMLPSVKTLAAKGYTLFATEGTSDFLTKNGIANKKVYKISNKQKSEQHVLEYIEQGKIDLIINLPSKYNRKELSDGYYIRRTAVDFHIPFISNLQVAQVFIKAITMYTEKNLIIKSWNEYQ
ncbi:MAG TPA: carbamoyl-phosphate synthase (glutamine-hydrolyzing) large subunit [Patescibacteria group bacterium]|nr:carbamoyl-phosphate synthase (glutamine-hydrolyzing) large subunit [Patescibacteria group bacterium]